MIILGIETSCDETALALIETRVGNEAGENKRGQDFQCRVIQSLVHSQAELHNPFGGVYPSLAKREHSKNLIPLLEKIVSESPCRNIIDDRQFKQIIDSLGHDFAEHNPELFKSFSSAEFLKVVPSIDAIAVTEGPGLEPALWVGINFARMLGQFWNIPIIPINHMEGHIFGSLFANEEPSDSWQSLKALKFPAIALLVSGGHTELVLIEDTFKYKIIGQTKDDAVGEAFDKVARILGLPYPGGPQISKSAHQARVSKLISPLKLPRPMLNSHDLDFSFSGLKTAVLYAVKKAQDEGLFNNQYIQALANEFEQSVIDVLDAKLKSALEKTQAQSIIVGGGVSANHALRDRLNKTAQQYGLPIFMPHHTVTGDNALMIALAGGLRLHYDKNIINDSQRILKADGTKRL